MIKGRRKHPRLRIPLEVEYLVAGEEQWRQGTVWNLGAGGAALLCEQELAVGTVLEGLHFVLAAEGDLPETRIEVGAEVVNIVPQDSVGRSSSFMLGLQFTGLGEEEFELLKQFVFRRLTAAHGPSSAARDGADPEATKSAPPIEIRFKLFDEFVEEVSENLSPSGMFLRAHRPLPPGSRFAFRFQLGEDFSLFQGTAEVVWTRRRSEGPERPAGMGVRFLDLDLTSQKLVKRLVGQNGTGRASDTGEASGAGDPPDTASATDAEPVVEVEEAEAQAGAQTPTGEEKTVVEPEEGEPDEVRTSDRFARLERRLAEAEEERDAARGRLLLLDEEAGSLRDRVRALESGAEAAGRREEPGAGEPRGDLEDQLRRSREELGHRQEEWERLEAELRAELERHSASEREFQERAERAAETEAELRQRLEQGEDRRQELEKRLERTDEAERALETLQAESDEMRQASEAVKAELESRLTAQSAGETELRQSLERAGEVEAELSAQLERSRAGEAELERRLSQAAGAEAELRQRLSEARTGRDELEHRLEESAEVEAALREQARESRATRDDLESRLVRVTAQLDRMRTATEEMKRRFNGDLSAAQAAGTDLARRLSEVAEAGAGWNERVERLTAARADLAERLTRITAAWSSLEGGLEEGAPEQVESYEPFPPASAESADDGGHVLVEPDWLEEPESAAAPDLEQLAVPLPEALWESLPEALSELLPEADSAGAQGPPVEPATATEAHQVLADEGAPAGREAESPEDSQRPESSAAGRLIGVARRAAALLGFSRGPATPGAGDAEAEPAVATTLEAKTAPVATEPAEPDGPEQPVGTEEPVEIEGPVGIEETVKAWAAAWSERRVEDYLSFYSREFEPSQVDEDEESGETSPAWLPPLAGMELTLGPISQVEMVPGRVAVQFEQRVESDSCARRTGRTLEMVREADSWKIAAESFQDL